MKPTTSDDAASAAHSRSVAELRVELDRRGIDYSGCLYRADLEALVDGLPKVVKGESVPRPRSKKTQQSVESLALLDGPPLFAALRDISGESERRRVTARVHEVKMALWRLKPTFRGMAMHLTQEVHPMFRNAFEQVLRASEKRGSVVVSSFESTNRSLHGHHGSEDRSWFPVLRRKHPELRGELDILEADHKALVALEDRIVKVWLGGFVALELHARPCFPSPGQRRRSSRGVCGPSF